jgi:hypothetical protein
VKGSDEKEQAEKPKSYVRVNIWFEYNKIWDDPGHVSLRIFDAEEAQIHDISFYPANDNGWHDILWSTGRPVTHTYDKFSSNNLPSENEQKGKAKHPNVILFFYTLDWKKMLEYWEKVQSNSTYCAFASSSVNKFLKVNNCITMAFNVLKAGGFEDLLNQYEQHQTNLDIFRNYLPSMGSAIALLLFCWNNRERKFISSELCFKLISSVSSGYWLGRSLGGYLEKFWSNFVDKKLEDSNFIARSVKSSVYALPSMKNIFWRLIPHQSKDWVITTPADFASTVLAAVIVEYKTCPDEIKRLHEKRWLGDEFTAMEHDLIDIFSCKIAIGNARQVLIERASKLIDKDDTVVLVFTNINYANRFLKILPSSYFYDREIYDRETMTFNSVDNNNSHNDGSSDYRISLAPAEYNELMDDDNAFEKLRKELSNQPVLHAEEYNEQKNFTI